MTDHLDEAERILDADPGFHGSTTVHSSLREVIAHLRASQPATESGTTRVARALDKFLAPTEEQPAPQPVEGVSDEELNAAYENAWDATASGKEARRALFNLGASRSSSAKDARIAELRAALADVRVEAIGAGPYRREALVRIIDKVDAALKETTP